MNYDTGSVKNIHYGDIHTKFPSIVSIDNNKDIPFINDDLDLSKFSEDQYLREGDLIIADASEDYEDIGKAIEVKDINNEKVLAGLHTILARDENDMAVNGFKAYLFSTNNLKTKIKIIANGISVLGISKNNLSKLNVEIPSKKEQQNIVSFISDIDKKIELLEKKHQLYLDFKNYLMQQIFAQKLRFDFDEDWYIDKIGNNSEVFGRIGFRGYTVDDLVDKGQGALTIGGKHISKNFQLDLSDPEYLSWEQYEESPEIKIYNGDVLLVKTASVGKVCFIENLNEPATLNPQLIVFKNIKLNNKFFYYYLTSNLFQKDIHKIKSTTGIPTITQKELLNLNIIYPSLEEQEKIVNFLSIVDKKISSIDKNLKDIKKFKKGLLQQMFVVRINWRCNFKLVKSPSFNKHLLILKNKIIFIIIK